MGQPEPCRDIKSVSRHHSGHSRSRPPNGVATPFLLPSPQARSRLHLSRSRPPGASPMSRHRFYVATLFLPIMGLPGRDAKIQVATSHTAAHVATSNPCRDLVSATMGFPGRNAKIQVATSHTATHVATSNQLSPISATSRRHFSMSRLPLLPPMSGHQIHVATSRPTKLDPTQSSQVATPISGRDLKLLLKASLHVATSKPKLQHSQA